MDSSLKSSQNVIKTHSGGRLGGTLLNQTGESLRSDLGSNLQGLQLQVCKQVQG